MHLLTILIAIVLGLLGSGLASSADPAKVLRYAIESTETSLDPAEISDAASYGLVANVFDAPLTYDYLAKPVRLIPNTLVALPVVTEGGTLYTLQVRPGIYFQPPPMAQDIFNGKKRELTAEDYVFSIKRIFDPKKRSPGLFRLEGNIVGMDEVLARARRENRFDYDAPVEGLRAIDRYTFHIRLKRPDYNLLYYLTICTLTCAVAREAVEAYGDQVSQVPIGTGPYVLASWTRSSKLVFEANPTFRNERFDGTPPDDDPPAQALLAANKGKPLPIVGRVEVYVIEEHQPRYLAFRSGALDLLRALPNDCANVAIPGNELAVDLKRSGVRMQQVAANDVLYTYFAMHDAVVGGYEPEKIALRRAIVLGHDIDREIRVARKNQAVRAQSPIGPGALGYDPNFSSDATRFNPVMAKALLDMYGYVDCDGDGYRDMPRRSSTDACQELTITYSSGTSAQQKTYNENWKRSMDAIGIRFRFKVASGAELLKQSRAGKLQMLGLSWTPGIPDAIAFFALLYGGDAGQANHSRFSLPAFDNLYDKARHLPPGPERNELYREMSRLFLVYSPWRLGVHQVITDLSHRWVGGYQRHPVLADFWKYVDIDTVARGDTGRVLTR